MADFLAESFAEGNQHGIVRELVISIFPRASFRGLYLTIESFLFLP